MDEKKAELCRLWTDIHVTQPGLERYYFVPTSWLIDILQDWAEIAQLSNNTIRCRHGLLNWKSMAKVKVVGEQIVSHAICVKSYTVAIEL